MSDRADILKSTGQGDTVEFVKVCENLGRTFWEMRTTAPSIGMKQAVVHSQDPTGHWRPVWFDTADLRDLIAAAGAALGDELVVVSRERLQTAIEANLPVAYGFSNVPTWEMDAIMTDLAGAPGGTTEGE